MDEESDDNFEWARTSSEDSDSECNDTTMAVDKSVNNYSDEDSESGKSFLKKLHKKVFTDDTPNGLSDCDSSKKLKKRKSAKSSDITSPVKIHIKHEPESDIAITKKNDNDENDTQIDVNELYLNVKVKEEISSITSNSKKEKKEKKESKSIIEDMFSAENTIVEECRHKKQKNKKKIKTEPGFEATTEEDETEKNCKTAIKNLHKQLFTDDTPNGLSDCNSSKKLKKRIITNNSDITSPVKKRIKHEPESDIDVTKNNGNHENDTQMDVNEHYLNIKVKEEISLLTSNSKKEKKDIKCFIEDMCSAEETIVEERQHKKQKKKLRSEPVIETPTKEGEADCKSNQKSTNLSERIMFEDDTFFEANVNNAKADHRHSDTDSFNSAINKNKDKITTSLKLNKIITANPDLKPIKPIKLDSNCHITKNDDVWILNFPKDFDVSSLENEDIIINKKSKAKIKEQTYTGVLNEDVDRLPVYSISKNKHLLHNVPVKGTINFQRKIPKVNFVKFDMVCSEPHFTQITEITRRHPLFGAHYKHDIKISKEVAEKLKPVHVKEYSETVSTRKSSKKKYSIEKNNQKFDTFLEITKPDSNEEIKTKKKKRKYTIDENHEEPPMKKTKKSKHDLNTAEAWESEKSIVENLFNF